MNKQTAIQIFSILAVVVGILISYNPPPANSGAIWGMVSMFIGYAIRDLFGTDDALAPPATPPEIIPLVQAAAPGEAIAVGAAAPNLVK